MGREFGGRGTTHETISFFNAPSITPADFFFI